MKNRNEMSAEEYLEYIPTEVENGFLTQEDLVRKMITRCIPVNEDRIYTSLGECARYLLDIMAENPGKDLYLTRYGQEGGDYSEICYQTEEDDNEYTDRLCRWAEENEDDKNYELKRLKEKEYQKELAKLNKKYGKS